MWIYLIAFGIPPALCLLAERPKAGVVVGVEAAAWAEREGWLAGWLTVAACLGGGRLAGSPASAGCGCEVEANVLDMLW